MLLTVLDANGNQQTVVVQSQSAAVDQSNSVTTTNASQVVMAANASRSGYVVQNQSGRTMWLNELGQAANDSVSAGSGSIQLLPGAFWPPPGWPISTAQVSIFGTAGDFFTAREISG